MFTQDANAQWLVECYNACKDSACQDGCLAAAESMPDQSWNAIEAISACTSNVCPTACGG